MILIKTDKCENEIDARSKERDYIEQYKASLNKIKIPYVSEEEKKKLYKIYYAEKTFWSIKRTTGKKIEKQGWNIHRKIMKEKGTIY